MTHSPSSGKRLFVVGAVAIALGFVVLLTVAVGLAAWRWLGPADANLRDLKLHDLQVEETIHAGQRLLFEARVSGTGYQDATAIVLLKRKNADGEEAEVDRQLIDLDPTGQAVRVRLSAQPGDAGKWLYIVELEPPPLLEGDKPIPPNQLRIERQIKVIGERTIKVLYVEGQPRYEFRYIRFLLEREGTRNNKPVDLRVLLLDADDEFAATDRTALSNFPPPFEFSDHFDLLIIGDCDPDHKKLRDRLKDIAEYVRGGGGALFIAGSLNNPHHYKGTPLADLLPIEPLQEKPPAEASRSKRMRPELTVPGRQHPIFRFSLTEKNNQKIWDSLAPIYWSASQYRARPKADVLAVHPDEKGDGKEAAQHPLVVYHPVGKGKAMFFGFDETWRWRLREGEIEYNAFWMRTIRYLARPMRDDA